MTLISDITALIQQYAPLCYQESFDNAGVHTGDVNAECTGVVTCLDVTEAIVDEAIANDCNLIVSHHPALFHALKSITGKTLTERILLKAIKHDIVLYAAHTNLDSTWEGVSHRLARMLGMTNVRTMLPREGKLYKLVVMTPTAKVEQVKEAVYRSGAGKLGNYDSCSFTVEGDGEFRALDGANPFVGDIGQVHHEKEQRTEFLVREKDICGVVSAMVKAHPYEEPAYDIIRLENEDNSQGLGVIGDIRPMAVDEFLGLVKTTFNVQSLRCSKGKSAEIRRVAICSGAGASFTAKAIGMGADAYITGDVGYHDFVSYGSDIAIADVGHYESEICTKEMFYELIHGAFPELKTIQSQSEINPITYL